jgi:hypothetical protein
MNHALRKRVHISISTNLQRSRILRLVLKSNIKCIEREELLDEFVNNELISNYQFSRAYSSELVEKFKLDYISCNNKHSSSLQFLTQRKNLLSTVLPSKFDISIRKFHTVMDKKILIDSDDKIGLCTLILRKSEKPWSGLGLEGYEEIIRFLNFNGYIVNIIGDIGSQCESWRKNKNIKLYYHMDYKLNPKVFQILSVYFSEFCIGDLSGAQVLPHFFNKKNLIFNAIPIGQFQYNSTIVPKIWMKNGIKCTMDQHFNELLFRYKNFRSANNEHFSTHFLPNDIMLKAVKVFISEADRLSCDFKGINKLDFTNDEKSLLHYAQASTISSVYIEFLNS